MTDINKQGLARVSFVLGFVSLFLMLGIITAIPGIITGHIARSRAINFPHQYAGSRIAILGLLMSYLSVVVIIIMIAVGDHLNTKGDLIPLLDVMDSSHTLSGYAKSLYGASPLSQ
ncbi:MAG TPA: DUF4190 domain-containing protein [Thiothrix sp.]|nr:DUF4190 domain-containing protein [Thiothrix sp.]